MSSKQKELELSFEFDMRGVLDVAKIEICPNGELLFYNTSGEVRPPPPYERVVSHSRLAKPKKIRSAVRFNGRIASLGGLDELAAFDQVVVIDTGQSHFPWREKIAFSAAVRLRFFSRKDGVEVVPLEDRCRLYEFRNYQGNPERLAALTLLSDLAAEGFHQPGCIVNDSDLGAHDAINNRTEPLFAGIPLPTNFHLQYAGDVGQEGLNRIVRACDRFCREFRSSVATGETEGYASLAAHPLIPSVRFRRAFRPDLCIEHGLIPRVGLLPGTTVQWSFS